MFKKGLAHNLTKDRNILSVLLTLLIFLIVFAISLTKFLYIFDKQIQDLYFKFNDIKVSDNIIVVEIDDNTLTGRKNGDGNITLEGMGRFPFDRAYYGTVIDNLSIDGAAVIGLDIIFGEQSNERSDNILAESIKNSKKVVLGSWSLSNGTLEKPYSKFDEYILTTGYYLPNIQKDDNLYENENMLYSIKPFSKFLGSDETHNHFTIALLRGYYSYLYDNKDILNSKPESYSNKFIISNKIELLRSRDNVNEILINYTSSDRFKKVSFLDVYYGNYKPGYFKDKIIIIGSTARGIKDVFTTPFGQTFGVYTHANVINTILTKNGIRYFDTNLEWFLIFLLIIVSVYFNISKSSYVLVLSNIALITIYIIWVVYITMLTNLLLNFPIELAIALIFSLAISNIVKYLIENKNKMKLNKALSEYVSKDIAHEILSGEGKINLDGENKNVAIFFSDIEGFTSISEKFSPEDLVGFLREYLSEMSNIIMDEKGFINKYEGDAIMALWGVFGEISDDSSYLMCSTALKQQELLKKLNIGWKERGFTEIKARMGMHYGNAIIGNIGSTGRKMEFTALGDSVNLASRLEGVNKFYGTYLCVSSDVYNIEKNNFEFRYLDKIRVKGKEKSINIYELISVKGELTEKQEKLFNRFEEGIEVYKEKNFKEAIIIFSELSEQGDGPSITYKKRCEIYIKDAPSKYWDGVSIMTSK